MAPGRPRRVQAAPPQSQNTQHEQQEQQEFPALFIDPMMGTPLPIYVDKDVEDRDNIVRLITSHGGTVSPNYSGVPYILVDPHKQSGQNLYRHYLGKKGKIVLASRWVYECIRLNQLQTFHSNYAGCKVTGKEPLHTTPQEPASQQPQSIPPVAPQAQQASGSTPLRGRLPSSPEPTNLRPSRNNIQNIPRPNGVANQHPPMPMQGHRPSMQPVPPGMIPPGVSVDGLTFTPYAIFGQDMGAPGAGAPPPQPQPSTSAAGPPSPRVQPEGAPPPPWQVAGSIAPSQTHLNPPPPPPNQEHMMHRPPPQWDGYGHGGHPGEPIPGPSTGEGYEYRYRDDGNGGQWVPAHGYYDPGYEQAYQPPYPGDVSNNGVAGPLPVPPGSEGNAQAGTSAQPDTGEDRPRGRKRTRTQPPPAAPASSLVVNRNGAARSPTPPSRIIKSTYGGNLFTADDVLYLRKYIDYCRDQGLVLSLREICERIAIRAPHHTFYSWRRYCNKHQIRLGGYIMNNSSNATPENQRSESTEGDWDMEASDPETSLQPGPSTEPGFTNGAASQQSKAKVPRNRSPTPPKALFRSTTGKGVAFTIQDRDFLISFMEFRKSQGRLDMVQFWKDVAVKAPHHSRASWMKYWRRHKHEFNRTETDAPLPPAPEKKMRYSRQDDGLLAKYFFERPTGTSDSIFQAFGRKYPHHPWKGWQEHHRIHKAKIDNLIAMLQRGESIDGEA
ncbi:hypothetical protein P691DRAFT_801085 [Macrolepiota fuliginosa MF-IS2]|uniref:BRCT domain-containing protein n=1 Tax=Macrolepiota fuliginosa MF-IS2 TaxID=1400762 RepID=A0A9P5XCJ0_9AGAR|nr:hypothetical protein P691DRAFT_801085 [Macrolepiota fuliginosa MF-IS2]